MKKKAIKKSAKKRVKKQRDPNLRAAPVRYDEKMIDKICQEIEISEKGLHHILQNPDYPRLGTIQNWLASGKYPYLNERYARAKRLQAEYMESQLLAIADDISNDTITTEDGREFENKEWVNRSKLRIDTRKWLMAKLYPKKYGDRVDVTTDGEKINSPVFVVNAVVNNELAKLGEPAKELPQSPDQ
jgi:hypothetical protein